MSKIQEGSIRYDAKKLKMSRSQVQRLTVEDRQKKLEENETISKIVRINPVPENVKGIDNELIVEAEKLINEYEDTDFYEKIEQQKKMILAYSVLYYEKYIRGHLSRGDKDSARASQCYKVIKNFPPKKKKITKKLEAPKTNV